MSADRYPVLLLCDCCGSKPRDGDIDLCTTRVAAEAVYDDAARLKRRVARAAGVVERGRTVYLGAVVHGAG